VSSGESVSASWKDYADEVQPSLSEATSGAEISPQRFAANVGRPYVFVQCTWDLPADKCKQCLDILSINVTDIWVLRREGQQKSYSCTVRYSNTSFMVVPFTAVPAPTPQYVFPAGRSSPDPAIASGEFFACMLGQSFYESLSATFAEEAISFLLRRSTMVVLSICILNAHLLLHNIFIMFLNPSLSLFLLLQLLRQLKSVQYLE
jgi:hypothetical protein